MTLTAGSRLGPYEIVAPLGAGGMGEVFKARDTRLDRSVAIKILPAAFAADAQLKLRFEREAKTISQLNHPHICTLYDVGDDYLVMELLEGESLADRLTKGPLPLDQVIRYGIEIAEALEKAHKAGVVHRDLKPGNVMLTKSGAKLLDFGLAKPASVFEVDGATHHKSLTQEGTIVGTFQYMAPEQIEGGTVDARTDIFALGTVLYEMATGKRAFEGKSKASLIASILTAEPQPISAIQPTSPPSLDRIIRTCLKKESDDRWQSAHDVATELRWIAEGESALRKAPTNRLAWIAAAVFAVASIVLAFVLWQRGLAQPAATPTRLQMLPPENTVFHFTGLGFPGAPPAISPDGTKLVFGANEPGKIHDLWLRSLDSMVAQRIPGTTGGSFPFWSPDSRWIAFFADNALKKIEIGGGAPVLVCNATDSRGGSWSPDGSTIIFAGRYAPIYRVSAAGGTPVEVTALDNARRDSSHRWPEFLGDSRHFLFLACPTGAVDPANTICVGNIDGSKMRKPLLSSADNPVLFQDQILFARNNVLMMQGFDSKKLAVTGEVQPLHEQRVENAILFSRSYFTVSRNGTLVYQAGGPSRDTQLTWFDRTGKVLGNVGEPGLYSVLTLAPDQRRVATSFSDKGNIWIFDLQRGVKSRVTFGEGHDMYPLLSPDGERLAYSNLSSGAMGIYIRDLRAGSEERLVANAKGIVTPSSWSPDGKTLVYGASGNATRTDIWTMSLADRKATPYLVTPFIETQGRLSPDGKWMAYQSTETGSFEIFIAPFPWTGAKWQVSTKGGAVPRWRADGRELFFVRETSTMVAVPIRLGPTPEIGKETDLFHFRAGSVAPLVYDVTGDGKKFLVDIVIGNDPAPSPLIVVEHFDAEVTAARKGRDGS